MRPSNVAAAISARGWFSPGPAVQTPRISHAATSIDVMRYPISEANRLGYGPGLVHNGPPPGRAVLCRLPTPLETPVDAPRNPGIRPPAQWLDRGVSAWP